jgi:hypothetical protein
MGLLIKNGNIITGDSRYVADILCENETITRIDHPFYPLMEPSVMPFTKRRIEKMKRTITGMLAIA